MATLESSTAEAKPGQTPYFPVPDTVPETDTDLDLRQGSPNSSLVELTVKPDITIYCQICNLYIDLRSLNEHRAYHRALETMYYKGASRPENVDMLIRRRRGILRKLKAETDADHPLSHQTLQKLNDAFEFLKADLEDTYETYRQIRENVNTDVSGVALNCSLQCASAVGICSDGNERWKNSMEDTRVFQDCFGDDYRKCFFGIYDGHNGRFASEVAANEIHRVLLKEMTKFDPRTKSTSAINMVDEYDLSHYDFVRPSTKESERALLNDESNSIMKEIIENSEEKLGSLESEDTGRKKKRKKKTKDPFIMSMSQAFIKAHKYTDFVLSYGKNEASRVRWSGCSTLSVIIQDTKKSLGMENVASDHFGDREMEKQTSEKLNNENEEQKGAADPPAEQGLIHLANTGNIHAVLVRDNKAYRITRDHTPINPKEKARIVKAGGTVNESERELRVNGVLATTRGLGNHGDPSLKKCVINEPYTTCVQIDQYAQFLILASNGVWEVFSEQEAASLLVQLLPSNQIRAPSNLSTTLNLLLAEENMRSQRLGSITSENQSSITDATRSVDSVKSNHSKESVTSVNLEKQTTSAARPDTRESTRSHVSFKKDLVSAPTAIPEHEEHQNQSEVLSSILQAEKEADEERSQAEGDLDSNFDYCYSEHESGHEADIDTMTDFTSLPGLSRLSGHIPMKDEIQREFAKCMAERLVQAALMAGSHDNITVMVILFPGCGL